jgi:hypothetical protein
MKTIIVTMRNVLFLVAMCSLFVGCADTDLSLDSPSTSRPPTASQQAADHATADPSLNTINSPDSRATNHAQTGWINSPAGDGAAP